MGWSSGSELYDVVISTLKSEVPDKETRKRIHLKLIDAFWDQDWDTQDECVGRDDAFDEAWEKLSSE